MIKTGVLKILQAYSCVFLAAFLCISAVRVYRDGAARKAANPTESIYTPEIAAEALTPAVFPISLSVILSIASFAAEKTEKKRGKTGCSQPAFRVSRTETESAADSAEEERRRKMRLVFIAAAAVLIVAGILNGGAADTLIKAVTICSECIGLG